MFSFRHSSDSN